MYGFKAFVFDGKKTARKAFETLEDYTPAYVWVDDVAELSKNKHGHMRVHSTWAQDDSAVGADAGFGAVTAGLVGMILGPAGAAAGAVVGGSLGALIGAASNVDVRRPGVGRLRGFARQGHVRPRPRGRRSDPGRLHLRSRAVRREGRRDQSQRGRHQGPAQGPQVPQEPQVTEELSPSA